MIDPRSGTFLKAYSYGIVADNKLLDTNEIKVVPVEIISFTEGDINTDTVDIESKGTDAEENEYVVKVKKSNAIKCKWLKWGSRAHTAPDVRKGMRVMIYRYADSNIFYWTSLGLDDHLMRLETVTWLFSNDPDGISNDPKSVDNSHSITVSTHEKHFTLQTVDTNGEEFTYTVKLDMANSTFSVMDNVNNYILLDSKNVRIALHNSESTLVELDKKNINLYAPDSYTLKADENINIECNNFTMKVYEDWNGQVGGDYSLEVGGDYSVTCKSFTCDSPTANFTGMVSVGGLSSSPGSAGGDGSATIEGDVAVTGGGLFSGNVDANKVSSTLPISAPNV